MKDWAPAIIASALFALLCPGGILQMPGRQRPVDFMNLKTSWVSILVHAVIYGLLLMLFIIILQVGHGRVRQITRRVDSRPIYFGYSWPEVVGLNVRAAKEKIKRGKPGLYIEVLSEREMQTMCYRTGRVRLIVDKYNIVVQTPRVG